MKQSFLRTSKSFLSSRFRKRPSKGLSRQLWNQKELTTQIAILANEAGLSRENVRRPPRTGRKEARKKDGPFDRGALKFPKIHYSPSLIFLQQAPGSQPQVILPLAPMNTRIISGTGAKM